MRFSDFEQWMFRLGAAAAIATLAAMAVRERISPPAAALAAANHVGVHITDTTTAPVLLRIQPSAAAEGSDSIVPHVYSGQPMSAAWANRLVDSVNRADVRLEKLEGKQPWQVTKGLCDGLHVISTGDQMICSVASGTTAAEPGARQ